MKRGVKFTIAFILSIVLCFSSAIVVYADPVEVTSGSYIENAGSLMNFFNEGSGTNGLDIADLTAQEVRTFGILLSNFVVPCSTIPNEIDTEIDKYNAWETFCKAWGKTDTSEMGNTTLLKSLLNRYKGVFTDDNMKQLFFVSDAGEECIAGVNTIMNPAILAENYIKDGTYGTDTSDNYKKFTWFPELYWKDGDNKKIVFSLKSQYIKAICSFIWHFNFGGITSNSNVLYISAFGDICYLDNDKYVVLVPACLNSWAFDNYKDDNVKIYLNNTYILGNFLNAKMLKNAQVAEGLESNISTDTLLFNDYAFNMNTLPKYDSSAQYSYSFLNNCIGNTDADGLGVFLHLGTNSMVPFLNGAYSSASSALKPIPTIKVIEQSGNLSNGESVYGGTQPLWSIGAMKWLSDTALNTDKIDSRYSNLVGVTGRLNFENELAITNSIKKELESLNKLNLTGYNISHGSDYFPVINDKDYTKYSGDIKAENKQLILQGTASWGKLNNFDSIAKAIADIVKKDDYEKKFVVFWLGGQWSDDNNLNRQISNNLTCWQIPIEDTVSTIGIFDTIGIESDGKALKSIEYVSDESNLKKFASGAFKDGYTAEDCYREHTAGTTEKHYILPESLYAFDESIDLTKGAIQTTQHGANISVTRNLFANIFWGYLEHICGIKINDNGTITNGTAKSFDWLPELDSSGLRSSLATQLSDYDNQPSEEQAEAIAKQKQAKVLEWTYKILLGGEKNAGEAFTEVGDYVVNWLKSITDSWFIGIHNKLIGIDMTSALTGTVANVGNAGKSGVYSTAVGYITTPTFESLPVTSWIVQNYQIVYIFLMLIVLVIIVFMVVSKTRRLREGAFIFAFMAFLLVLPMQLLDWGIIASNEVSEGMYNDKFMYWAVMQHAEAIYNYSKAENTTQANLQDNLSRHAEQTKYGGVTVKWLSPKKWGITEKLKASSKNANGMSIFIYLAGDMLDGEVYTGDENSTYLYRSYRAIWMEANNMYKENISNKSAKLQSGEGDLSKVTDTLKKAWLTDNSEATKQYGMTTLLFGKGADGKEYDTTYFMKTSTSEIPQTALFRYTTDGDTLFRSVFGGTWINQKGKLVGYPVGYYDSYYAGTKIMDVRHNTYSNNERIYQLYLDKDLTNKIATFNVKNVKWNKATENKACGLWLDVTEDEEGVQQFTPTSGIRTFLDYSESPYYYFYSVLKDTVVRTSTGTTINGGKDFISCLLSKDMFEVTDTNSGAYGMTKDYLDLEGLFTYVIPYLRYANQDVFEYKDNYSLEVSKKDYKDDEEYQKHRDQLQAIWNLYSPWVDALCTASGGTSKANSGFGEVTVGDQLNPASYFKVGRPIAYSPAESVLRAYSDVDLTSVERKMQAVLTKTREDMIELLNYKDLTMINSENGVVDLQGNDILVSAAAMLATFHFNQEFSDVGPLHTNVQLYPLNFELENMNYDSYLRLIVGNSMGTNLKLQQNLTVYDNLIHNTSIITALILILVDIFGVFVIPVMKICLIVVIFIMALALCVSCVLNKPDKFLSTILSTFVIPLCLMIIIFTAHAIVVSWFVGQGVTGVINSRDIAITTGDPTITLILLLLVDIVTSFCMWLLLKFAFTSAIKYIKATAAGLLAVGSGTVKGVLGAIAAVGSVSGAAVGATSLAAKGVGTIGKGAFGTGKAVMGGNRTSHQTSKNTKEMLKMMKGESGTASATSNQQQSQTLPKPAGRTVGKLGPTGGDNQNGVKPEQSSSSSTTAKKADDKKGNAVQFSEAIKDMRAATNDLKNATQNLEGAEKGTSGLKPKPMAYSGKGSDGVNDRPFEVMQHLFKPSVKGEAETAQDAYVREKAEAKRNKF